MKQYGDLKLSVAVLQCERKEEYIEKIQCLDFDTKAAIAAHIQEVLVDTTRHTIARQIWHIWMIICIVM